MRTRTWLGRTWLRRTWLGRTWLGALPALLVLALLFAGGMVEALRTSLTGGGAGWSAMFASPDFLPSLALTTRVAVVATGASLLLGFALALAIRRVAVTRGGRVARILVQVPLPVPHLVLAIAILMLLDTSGLVGRLLVALGLTTPEAPLPELVNDSFGFGIIAAYVLKEAPFVAVLVLSSLREHTTRLEEAAANLGASRLRVLRDVTLPAALPSLRLSGVLLFAYTFGAFEVPQFLGQTRPTMLGVLAWQLYTDVDLANRPAAMAVALLLTVVVAAVAVLVFAIRPRRRRA